MEPERIWKKRKKKKRNGYGNILPMLMFIFHWCLQSWLRVSQLFHTVSQVVVGAVLGTIFSILWYLSWDAIVLKAFMSSFWVQAIVVLGAAGFCLGFLVHVVRYWLRDEDEISK